MKNCIYALSLFVFALLMSSCEEEVVYVFNPKVVMESVVNDFVNRDTYGIEQQIEIACDVANESLEHSAETYTGHFQNDYSGMNGWYSYSLSYEGIQNADYIAFNSQAEGKYETLYMTSDDDITNGWTLSEIVDASDLFKINGISSRKGNQYSKYYEDSFDSEIEFTFDQLELNRVTSLIKSGTIIFNYTGESSYGEVYTASGTIQYSDYNGVISYDE